VVIQDRTMGGLSLALEKGRRRGPGRWLRMAYLPVLLALVAVVSLGLFADRQNRVIHDQQARAAVLAKLGIVRANLEGNVSSDIQLVRGLVAVLSTEPGMSQHRFGTLVESLMGTPSDIRNIAAAPDFVVRMLYPRRGNEKAIGLNYLTNTAQRDAVLRARDTGELVLAGPLDLVQGGKGLIGRFPVFIPEPDGNRAFWGIVSAVLDVAKLFERSGLADPDLGLDIALVGRDGKGAAGELFYGSPAVLDSDPVSADVALPSGHWQIAAVPTGGWSVNPPNTALIYLLVAVAGFLVVVPMLVTGHFYSERRSHIEELSRREHELARLSRRLELALDASRVGVWEMDIRTGDLVWDDRMKELYGLSAETGAGEYAVWRDRLHPDDLAAAEADFAEAVRSRGRYLSEFRIILPHGETRTIRAVGAVYDEPGGPAKIIGVNWDVSQDVALNEALRRAKTLAEARNGELERAKERIEHTSLHDALTGLPNRRFLENHLARMGDESATPGSGIALLHIDLDRFKQINDTLGHAAGDAMLLHAASVMQANLRPGDVVARIGGDEFVAVCRGPRVERFAADLAQRLVRAMREPVTYDGHECRLGVSVGVACVVEGPVSGAKLLIDADIALYRAKNRGRNRWEFFTEDLQAEVVRAKRTADEILGGLERGEFAPVFQPQFDARTHALVGAEALARWHHPVEGVLAPDRFLKVAEDIAVVSAIDRCVLVGSLDRIRAWRAAGFEVPRVSVNVSLRRLHDETLVAELRELDIEPGLIGFELVESIYLDDDDEVVSWNIDNIKELGIDIEIDDFGTGYASIVSLIKLRPRRLKIDRQLVLPVVSSAQQRKLVRSIVEIGKSMDIEIIAEGVETMEHADVLADLGCDILQGYAFSRPLDADCFERFLTKRPLVAGA
jgi:diguanylate cyclase (GGDEF)-like protein